MSYGGPSGNPYETPSGYPPPAGQQPGKVQAIAIMTIVGGCMAFMSVFASIGLASACCVPILFVPYNITLGVLALVKGIQLVNDREGLQSPPTAVAIMMIINIISLDVVNLVMGILILVFLSDPEVKRFYRIG
jgi:hypothetical protein